MIFECVFLEEPLGLAAIVVRIDEGSGRNVNGNLSFTPSVCGSDCLP